MSPALLRTAIVASLALVLAVVDGSIASKERIRRDGELLFLELAPVDPRSLMQGDYMALRFALADEISGGRLRGAPGEAARALPAEPLGEGGFAWAPVALDGRRVATLAAPDDAAPLRLRYRLRAGRVWLGTNAFFFQEGDAERYRGARYGEFRLDRATGEAVLVGLRGAELEPLPRPR